MTGLSNSCAAILAWLATVQPSGDIPYDHQEQAQPSHPRKRRRIDSNAESKLPLSPPVSHSTDSVHSLMDSTPRQGRKRKHDDSQQVDASGQDNNNDSDEEQGSGARPTTHDINATPRASQLNDRHTPSLSSASSVTSRTSSPTKQLRRLALEADGFVHRKFASSRADLPPSLAELVKELKDIARGNRLIPQDMRTEYADLDIPDDAFADETEPRTPKFRFPPRGVVVDLLNGAIDCEENTLSESEWNTEVHFPMMKWVLRPDGQRGLVDYTSCPNAQVAKAYRARNTPSNLVDFYMVIRPAARSPEAERIDEVRKKRPDVTINHSDKGLLCKSPIVVSFETKRHGADFEKATVQMGTWHSSQWRSLAKDPNPNHLPAMPFLAGVIISGHSWSFVASAIKDGKSVLYSEVELGKTSDEFGIITTLVALQHLARWAENSYWPMFKSDILQM